MFVGTKKKIGSCKEKLGQLYEKAYQKLFCYPSWFIAFKNKDSIGGFAFHDCIKILSPRNHFYADPFLIKKDKKNYVFFEDLSKYDNKAVISFMEIYDDCTYSKPQKALETDYHLSYPFLYEGDGNVYMIPETHQNRSIEVYKAEAFPDQWVLDAVIMDNIMALDTTIFMHNGKLWMFTSIFESWEKQNTELSLFFADTIHGPWHSHPHNPIVTDINSARPAGNLFYLNGKLIRPGQNCKERYGNSIVLNNVLVLNEHEYKEERIHTIQPNWYPDNLCTHTYNFNDDIEVIDGKKDTFDLFKIIGSFLFRVNKLVKLIRHCFLTIRIKWMRQDGLPSP